MRLICPNCGAQYEIDEGLIPAAGRDVQCSNCGNTWFETPGASVEAETLAEDVPAEQEVTSPPASEAEPPDAARAALEHRPETPAPGSETIDAEPVSAPPGAKAEKTPSLDPEVAAILREEAEHERQRRNKAAEQIESQPDLGLDAPAKPKDEAAGRDRLPDIEEINSSLRSDTASEVDDAMSEPGASGFWRGVWLMILLAIALVLLYTAGPKIAARVPQAAPAIESYRTGVDGLRLKLDNAVNGLGARMEQERNAQ